MTEVSRPPEADTDLVSLAQSGQVEAFEGLYRDNVGRVYAVCLRMTRDAAQAEDLTQEAFVRAWRKLKSFRGESAFSTWLHRLTVNLVLTHLRSEGRRTARVVVTDDLASVDKSGVRPRTGERVDLEAAIATLAVVEENLAIIEGAINNVSMALADNPDSAELERMLHVAYRSEVNLLRQAVQLADDG